MKLLEQFDRNQYYSEIEQARPCGFAFALVKDDTVEVNHRPVKCRDFLNDSLCWIAGEVPPDEIYGYNYNGEIEKAFTSLVIYDFGNIEKNISALNDAIVGLGIAPSVVVPLEKAVLVTGDKFWMQTTVHLSFYTTVLRGLTYSRDIPTLEDIPCEGWMSKVHQFIPKLPKVLLEMPVDKVTGCLEVDEEDQESTLHEFNGWATACDNHRFHFNRYGGYLRGKLCQA